MQTFDTNNIKNFNDVFEIEDHVKILHYLEQAEWKYGHSSDKKNEKYNGSPKFWIMDLSNKKFFTEILFDKIQKIISKKCSLITVYANGHTYGTKGRPHQDWYDEKGLTFLYYPNPNWSLEWQGNTVFLLDEDKYYFNVPKPNSAILFPGMMFHYAEETSRLFPGLRMTIAWKLLMEN